MGTGRWRTHPAQPGAAPVVGTVLVRAAYSVNFHPICASARALVTHGDWWAGRKSSRTGGSRRIARAKVIERLPGTARWWSWTLAALCRDARGLVVRQTRDPYRSCWPPTLRGFADTGRCASVPPPPVVPGGAAAIFTSGADDTAARPVKLGLFALPLGLMEATGSALLTPGLRGEFTPKTGGPATSDVDTGRFAGGLMDTQLRLPRDNRFVRDGRCGGRERPRRWYFRLCRAFPASPGGPGRIRRC